MSKSVCPTSHINPTEWDTRMIRAVESIAESLKKLSQLIPNPQMVKAVTQSDVNPTVDIKDEEVEMDENGNVLSTSTEVKRSVGRPKKETVSETVNV